MRVLWLMNLVAHFQLRALAQPRPAAVSAAASSEHWQSAFAAEIDRPE